MLIRFIRDFNNTNNRVISFLRYCLFGSFFAFFVLSFVLFANYQRHVEDLAESVERSTLNLLDYIEYDPNKKFYISEENTDDAASFINSSAIVRPEGKGSAYISLFKVTEQSTEFFSTNPLIQAQ